MKKSIEPTSWIYLLVHAVVFAMGISLSQIGGPIMVAIGTSLIATGVAGWVIFFWVRKDKEDLKATRSLRELGLVEGFQARSVPIRSEYESRFSASRREISIIGFGLNALRGDFLDQFITWSGRTKVRILLIDPGAPAIGFSFADQRDTEENNPTGTIRSEVMAFISSTSEVRRAMPESFQVRLYSAVPTMNICIIDDEVFWGPYIIGQQSRNMPTLLCRRGGRLYEDLHSHFDVIWNDEKLSRTV